jgi:hypothetical protein
VKTKSIINVLFQAIAIFVVISWMVVLLLPLAVLNCPWLQNRLERLAIILSPLGTYGDLFGSINSLFSGLGRVPDKLNYCEGADVVREAIL